MPTEQTRAQLTDEEVAGFVEKLEVWRETLSDKEQRLLEAVLVSALEPRQGEDVQGYFIGGMLTQLAQQLQPKLPSPAARVEVVRRRFEDVTKE
jgi:hypothetical protein